MVTRPMVLTPTRNVREVPPLAMVTGPLLTFAVARTALKTADIVLPADTVVPLPKVTVFTVAAPRVIV